MRLVSRETSDCFRALTHPKLCDLCGACTRCLGRPGYNLGMLLEFSAGLRARGCLFTSAWS
jgi:hypothetical protein